MDGRNGNKYLSYTCLETLKGENLPFLSRLWDFGELGDAKYEASMFCIRKFAIFVSFLTELLYFWGSTLPADGLCDIYKGTTFMFGINSNYSSCSFFQELLHKSRVFFCKVFCTAIRHLSIVISLGTLLALLLLDKNFFCYKKWGKKECTPLASSYWVKPKMQIALSAPLIYHMTADLTKSTFGDPDLCWEMKIINHRSRYLLKWSDDDRGHSQSQVVWMNRGVQRFERTTFRSVWTPVSVGTANMFEQVADSRLTGAINSGSSEYLYSCEWHLSSASR